MSGDIARDLRLVADASKRADGSDIPLGQQLRTAADALEAKDKRIADLEAALVAMEPHIRKIHGCAHINDEMGRVVTGQAEAARELFALFEALSSSPAGEANG